MEDRISDYHRKYANKHRDHGRDNLAGFSSNASLQVRIIVIDPFDKLSAASSSQCKGCFHQGFLEKETQPLLPLGK